MKRILASGTALFLAALGLATVLKVRTWEKAKTDAGTADPERVRVTQFWNAYSGATTLRIQGQCAEAEEVYRQALQLNPRHEDSLYYLGTCLSDTADYREAEATLRKLIALDPESGRGYGQLGRLLSSLAPGAPSDFAQAEQAFERELHIYREQAGPLLELGSLELKQGHLARAEQDFRTATSLGSPEARFLAGYVLFLQDRLEEANRFFQQVLEFYWADRKITAKGVLSEGDVLPATNKPLTALQRAALKSMLFSYWIALRRGETPSQAAAALHVHASDTMTSPLHFEPGNASVRKSGGRAAWADFDADGTPDLVVGGLGLDLVLYRNEAGRFADVTQSAGLAGIRDVWEPYWVDFDGDGYPDLYLIRSGFTGAGQNLFFHNNRNGTFSNVTAEMGLSGIRSTIRACFADFDGDGKLDILEVGAAAGDHPSVRLFRNTGKQFVDITNSSGLVSAGTAADCSVADYDGDGRPDVFVQFWAKDAILYHNEGKGRFLDVTNRSGLQGLRGPSLSSIFFDYDNDGRPDLLVASQAPPEDVAHAILEPTYQASHNTPRLFHNRGDGTFQEVTREVGFDHPYGTMQALAADLDGDGWMDLLLISGSTDAEFLAPTVFLHNVRGERFEECSCVPRATTTGNSLGAALSAMTNDRTRYIYFASNPALYAQKYDGLFRITRPRELKHAPATGDHADARHSSR